MTDTAYDGESFRARLINVRLVKRNQRTLPGVKIAVKVIDQTGTEHMAVLDDPWDPQWY